MQKQIKSKKFLSAILSISVIMATLFAFPAYATEMDTGSGLTITAKEGYEAKAYALTDEQISGADWFNSLGVYIKKPWFTNLGDTKNKVSYTKNDGTNMKDSQSQMNCDRLIDGIVSNSNYCTGDKNDGGMLFKVPSADTSPLRFQINLGGEQNCASILLCWREKAPKSYKIYASNTTNTTFTDTYLILTVENETETNCNRLITFDSRQKFWRICIEFCDFASNVEDGDSETPALLLTELGVYNRAYSANVEVSDDYGAFSETTTCWKIPETLISTNLVFGGGNAYLIDDSDIGVDDSGEKKKYSVYIHSSAEDGNIFNNKVFDELSGKRLIVVADGWYFGVSNGVKVYQYNGSFILGDGDINGDGAIDSNDLCLMRKKLLDIIELDKMLSDINNDSMVDICDLVKLKIIENKQ